MIIRSCLAARTAAQARRPLLRPRLPGPPQRRLAAIHDFAQCLEGLRVQAAGAWPACRNLALDPPRVREVAEDLLVRLRGVGSHLYSPGKTIQETGVRQRFGLAEERRLLVAYTSSLDELIASRMGIEALGIEIPDRTQPFKDQIEWLQALVDYVEESEDLSLIVRIHPREGSQQARIGRFATSVASAGRVRGSVRALSVCLAGRSRLEL